MSILINGMEMPTNCESCPCKTADAFGDLGCQATGYIPLRKANQDRPYWCPLVPVTEPHGRLGDMDELYVSLKKWLIQNRHSMTEATRVWVRGVLEGIAAAPTIIPASEEGE